jgi:hypothetical protein
MAKIGWCRTPGGGKKGGDISYQNRNALMKERGKQSFSL